MFSHLLYPIVAVSAILLAAAVGMTSRRGFVLVLIGTLLSWAPDWKEGFKWLATVGVIYAVALRFAGLDARESAPERHRSETQGTRPFETDEPRFHYTWIGELSAERIGKTWRTEDHETLLRAMKRVDELAIGLVAYAARKAKETAFKERALEDSNGARPTTESVGFETQSHGN
jgi:hypothetical protein